jgi:hypothetical protein
MRSESELPEAASADQPASNPKRSWQRPKIVTTDASEAQGDFGASHADSVGFS